MQQSMQHPIVEKRKITSTKNIDQLRTRLVASLDHVLIGWRSKNEPKLKLARTADDEK